MRLLGSTTSPYVRKVRIVLAEKKLDYKFELLDVWSVDRPSLPQNPLGKIPCLILDGGDSLYDSRVIVEYVDTLSPVGRLIPDKGRERAEVRTWESLADGMLDAAVAARLEQTWPHRTESQRCQAWINRQMNKIECALNSMEAQIRDKPWCCSTNHPTLADIAVGCALGYLDFRFEQFKWRDLHPALAKLSERLEQRSSFIDSRPSLS